MSPILFKLFDIFLSVIILFEILEIPSAISKNVGRDSEFYFRNFTQSANKSFKAARRTATARFRKTAPKQSRDAIDEMAEIWGIELDN